MKDNEQYEVTERDIEAALRWLKYNDPEYATREQALALLKDLQSGFHNMAHRDPEKLLELQAELKTILRSRS
jgi:hypothetical protein